MVSTKAEAEALSVEELKTELTSRGLPTEGLKVGALSTLFLSTSQEVKTWSRWEPESRLPSTTVSSTEHASPCELVPYITVSFDGGDPCDGADPWVLPLKNEDKKSWVGVYQLPVGDFRLRL